MHEDALTLITRFRASSLAGTIAQLERELVTSGSGSIRAINAVHGVDDDLLRAAADVKRLSAQIDVVMHAVGILYALPHILEPDEVVESTSLGAGNAGSPFDVVTDRRIAEFKFIRWQGGSEAVRKKTFFEDDYKLVRHTTTKAKYCYLLDTRIPLQFLRGRSNVFGMLDHNNRLRNDFIARYGQTYGTVGQYFAAHHDAVNFIDLTALIPGIGILIQT